MKNLGTRTLRILVVLVVAACSGPAASSAAGPATPGPTTAATVAPQPTTTPEPPVSVAPTVAAGPPISVVDGVATIDAGALAPLVFVPAAGSSSDPFFHIHTTPASDGFFLAIELYTVYGSAWTGQTGTFEIGCTPAASGICVHFDPDGPGPQPNLGADFKATGQIRIDALDANGYDVTLSNVAFSDGTTIPGPLRLISG